MAIFGKPKYSTVNVKKRDIPKGLWTKCPNSGEMVYNKDLEKNLMVVPNSGYHFPLPAHKRIASLVDKGTFQEKDQKLSSKDPLKFKGVASYSQKLKDNKEKSGLTDAIVSGVGEMNGRKVSLAVMDFRFLGASMGSVVGEKVTRLTELAIERRVPLVLVTASGGARMYEGLYSLMQMAKTSGAVGRHHEAGLPYIVILSHPTTGGVTASFASLGDIIVAEPGALIGFAGPRVIKQTTQATLPEGFQTAEFLKSKGFIDRIVARKDLRQELSLLLAYLS